MRWDLNDRLNLGVQAEYNFTPRDEGDNDVSALELKLPFAFKLDHHWSAALTYKVRWDLLAESDRHRIALAATRI